MQLNPWSHCDSANGFEMLTITPTSQTNASRDSLAQHGGSYPSKTHNVFVRLALCGLALLLPLALAIAAGPSQESSFQTYKNDPHIKLPRSGIEKPEDIGRKAHTDFLLHTGAWNPYREGPKSKPGVHPPTSSFAGYSPAQIKAAYGIASTGGSGVICIVDAYDYPTALNDFNAFSQQYGLPQESSTNVTASTNRTFQIVYGSGSQPASDPDWNMEEALDIEWSHAMAPNAKIVLVEAASNSFEDLYTAVATADGYPGVREVSISWGGSEFAEETEYDSFFAIEGIAFFVAAGDTGGAQQYPAESPYVIGCGGTSLYLDAGGARTSEIAWINSGGGPSYYEPLPYYQDALTAILGSRGCPDMASDSDPNTGVAVYDSTSDNGYVGWVVLGGTSVAAPTLAGVNNAVNDGEPNTPDELAQIYSRLGTTAYYDITQGTAGGFVAVPGWDFITGVGTLNGTSLQVGSPWAQFHANSNNTGLGMGAGAGAGLKWMFPTASTGLATPAIGVDGTIYVSAQDDGLYAINSATGRPNWVTGFGTPTGTPAIGADGSLYLSSPGVGLDSDSVFSLFGPEEPLLNWADYTGLCDAPPVIGGGIIYVASITDGIFAIHAATGGLLWDYNTGELFYPPAVGSNGFVYIGDQLGYFYAFEGATGVLEWEQSIGNLGGTSGGWTSPAIGPDGTVYVGYALTNSEHVASGGLAAFNGATGILKWTLHTNSVYNSPAIGPNGDIYFSDDDGYLYAVTDSGAEAWSHKLGSNTDGAVDSNGVVYVGAGADLLAYNGASGQLNWTFTVPAGDSVQTAPAIGADGTIYFGSSLGSLFAIGANTISTLKVSPASVVGGTAASGQIQITGIAGASGVSISLQSSSVSVKVPSSVSVASNGTEAGFAVSTSAVSTTQSVTLTATLGSSIAKSTLTVLAPSISSFVANPTSVTGGQSSSMTVTMSAAGGSSGAQVLITSNDQAAIVPSSVTIGTGSPSASFTVQTKAVSSNSVATLTAKVGASSQTATLTILPATISALSLSSASVLGGQSPTATVHLASVAGPEGDVVKLSSSSSEASVPATITVPANTTSVSFTVPTKAVSGDSVVTVKATFGLSSQTATLTLMPASLSSIAITPTSVVGGQSATGTINLSSVAGPAGDVVKLSSNDSEVVLPATVTVPAAKTLVTFTAQTTPVSANAVATIRATFGTTSQTASLTLKLPAIALLDLNPTSVVGGASSEATVYLAAAAGAHDVVQITANSADVTVPASVTFTPGQAVATFTIQTKAVTTAQTVTITVTLGASTTSEKLTITP